MTIKEILPVVYEIISWSIISIGAISYLSKKIAEKYIATYFEIEKAKFQNELSKELEVHKVRYNRIYSEQIKSIEEIYKITANIQNKLAYMLQTSDYANEDFQNIFREVFDQMRELKHTHNLKKIYFSEELNNLIESYTTSNINIFNVSRSQENIVLNNKDYMVNNLNSINDRLIFEFKKMIGINN